MMHSNPFTEHPWVLLILLNMISFCIMKLYWLRAGKCGANLEVLRPAKSGEKMYYLVAGCVNQPRTAFGFLLNELNGGVTLVNYRSIIGTSIQTIAKQVIKDAKDHDYQTRVIGISIGDYVARRAEDVVPSAMSVGINPEPISDLLNPWASVATKVGSILAEILAAGLGWLSLIPWYNGCGNYFSLSFIADQFCDIGFVSNTPHITCDTLGIIISQRPGRSEADGDEFLSNSSIRGCAGGGSKGWAWAHCRQG